MNEELKEIVGALKNYMKMEEESGLQEVALKGLITPVKDDAQAVASEPVYEDRAQYFEKLIQDVKTCRDCDLCTTRRNTVFGEGNINAKLMFVGEAPGLEEDIQGKPFVGRSGKLLTKMIEAIGIKREDVYIANCLKCRPPKNRTPLPSEIVACRNYLLQQIDTIKPKVICCLGRPAAQTLLMTDTPIGRLRGKFYDYRGIKLMPTFHPAYLLRNPAEKRHSWEDLKKVRDELKG